MCKSYLKNHVCPSWIFIEYSIALISHDNPPKYALKSKIKIKTSKNPKEIP